ncbi:MAG: zinc ribbon domain-containing protein [Anaerolineae bacterium]|jgi:hypothetical protein
MSIGSILVGVALALVVGAYLARPFRSGGGLDRQIEAWVAQVREAGAGGRADYCSQCGRRVGPDDRFCPGCGTALQGGGR